MKPLKNLKTLGRLGKGTALLVAKPLSLREALQTLEICAKANVAILPQGDPTWNKIMAFVCRCLDVFVVVPKKQPGKMNDDHSQGSRMSTTKIKNKQQQSSTTTTTTTTTKSVVSCCLGYFRSDASRFRMLMMLCSTLMKAHLFAS